jgi:transcriptional regulator with XRE-family HTH domain
MNRIKELREERGFTVRKLSELIGIQYQSINRYENEVRDISTDLLKVFASFFEVSIDYLLMYSGYCIYLKYNNVTLKVNHDNYNLLVKQGLIYFDDNNHRCVKLNELIGLDGNNDLSEFIIEMNRCNKINDLFDKNSFGIVNEEYVNKVISDVEIILDSRLIKFIRDSIK